MELGNPTEIELPTMAAYISLRIAYDALLETAKRAHDAYMTTMSAFTDPDTKLTLQELLEDATEGLDKAIARVEAVKL